MEQIASLRKNCRVTILTKFEGVMTSYWCHRDQAVDFLDKYSDVDENFISGIVQVKLGRSYVVIYFKVK
jgi:ActR/RegA family two-component response regulator